MKILTATLLSTALLASPAWACSWNKSAESKTNVTAAYTGDEVKVEDKMSTFDPVTAPAFEETEAATDSEETIEEAAE